jgi:hypothetical protein
MDELTRRQRRSIPFLLQAVTIEQGCRAARISKQTYYTWLEQLPFRNELDRQRREMISTALDSLKLHVVQAAETLTGLLSSESPSVRQRAAETILSFTTKSLESDELLQRILDLERKVAAYERPA